MNHPRVSVVTVCYNSVDELEKTIMSVLHQTYSDIEYLVIDGGSTDGTIDVIKKYSDRIAFWVSEHDKGIYDAMNKGILHATGEWIHFLNAGDVYHGDSVLSDFIPQIANTTQIAYGDTQYVFPTVSKVRKALPLNKMDQMMPMGHPASFVRLSYQKEHLFDISYRSSGDYKFFYNSYYREKVNFQYIPLVVAEFDAEGGISTSNPFLVIKEDARLRGIHHTIRWRLWYGYFMCRYTMSQLFKSMLPKHMREQLELRAKLKSIEQS